MHSLPSVPLGLAAVFFAALGGTYLIRRFAIPLGLIDIPNARSSHVLPTARGGGIAIALVFLSAAGVLAASGRIARPLFLVLLAGGGAVAAIGVLDDRWSIPARIRFAVHIGAAVLAVSLLGWIVIPGIGPAGQWLGAAMSALAIVWCINFFNFMDGIDGLAALEVVFVATAGAGLTLLRNPDPGMSLPLLALAAACSGFLFWNWPPARIFMGDVGSGFCGFTIAALALGGSRAASVPVAAWLILSGAFLVDASVTLIRRGVRGDRWFEAHRLHAYQHLARRFNAHLPVTVSVLAVDVCWLLPWAWYATVAPDSAFVCLSASLGPLTAAAIIAGAGRKE